MSRKVLFFETKWQERFQFFRLCNIEFQILVLIQSKNTAKSQIKDWELHNIQDETKWELFRRNGKFISWLEKLQ